MKLYILLKKDILLIKKYLPVMLAAAVLIPPFMLWRAPEYPGALGFILSAVFCVLMLLQFVLLKEYRFPGAAALLCAAPFSRKAFVLSKYLFCIGIYLFCCAAYAAEALFIPGLRPVPITLFFLVFGLLSAFISVYLPAQYMLGYEKTKLLFVAAVMASPFVFPLLFQMQSAQPFPFLSAVSPPLLCMGTFLFSCGLLAASAAVSVRLYSQADL